MRHAIRALAMLGVAALFSVGCGAGVDEFGDDLGTSADALGNGKGKGRGRPAFDGGGPPFGGAPRMTICHRPPGNPFNARAITIGFPAVMAHEFHHGDTLGPCPVEDAGTPDPDAGTDPDAGMDPDAGEDPL